MSQMQYDPENQMNEDPTFAWASKRVPPGKEITLADYINSIGTDVDTKPKPEEKLPPLPLHLTLHEYIGTLTEKQREKLFAVLDDSDGFDTPSAINDTVHRRGTKYGRFTHNSGVTQKLKAVVRDGIAARFSPDRWANGEAVNDFSPFQLEAIDMILHKLGRIISGDPDYADSWHDIAGYAVLVEKILNGENP